MEAEEKVIMLYEWADNHSHQSRRPLSFAGGAKTALAGALSISWMGKGEGDLVCKGVTPASPLLLKSEGCADATFFIIMHGNGTRALLSDDRQIWHRRRMHRQQEQDGMERLDREIIDLPRKWRRGRRSHFLAVCPVGAVL